MGPAHLGIGFAAKTISPELPLWTLLVGSEAFDLLSFTFTAVGIEKVADRSLTLERGLEIITPGSIPWSHGLLMSILWSMAAAGITYLVTRNHRSSLVLGSVVFSHWILDFIVHPPDLPLLFQGSATVGLGLWSTGTGFIISLLLQIVLIATGVAIYIKFRRKGNIKSL